MKKTLSIARIKGYFNAYPKLNTMWFTSDGSGFTTKELAIEIATAKKMEMPREVTRAEVEALKGDEKALPGMVVETSAEYTEEQANEALKSFKLNEDCDWEELQKLGKFFDVKARSKADYIAALLPMQAALTEKKED